MKISTFTGDIKSCQTDGLVVNLFEGVKVPEGATGVADKALGGIISELISNGEITGREGECTLIHKQSATYADFMPKRVLVVGLGRRERFSVDTVRGISAVAGRRLREASVKTAATILHGAGIGGLDVEKVSEAVVEGTLLGLYRFMRYQSRQNRLRVDPEEFVIVEHDPAKMDAVKRGVDRGKILSDAASFARDLVNEPANHLTPEAMADAALKMASHSLDCNILDKENCAREGMGAYLGVANGSHRDPKFIHFTYKGDPDNNGNNVWFIGKSITFDTGGISLKPAANMGEMKGDMGGGAAVMGAMRAIKALNPKINVHGVCPATENMPGGAAQRPGDVVRAMNGLWIEVDNTDAEGRLTLADALSYANKNGAERIVTIATLTGAIRIALGRGTIGGFSNDDTLFESVKDAGERRGESVWRLPLDPVSKRQNESKIADIKNTGGRYAGAITAAHFVSEFAGSTPWVHLDIAGVSMSPRVEYEKVYGATGATARLLTQLALNLAIT